MVEQLLARMAARNIELWVEGERLRFRAPKGALTPALRQQLKQHKAAVVTHLQRQAEAEAQLKQSAIRPISPQPYYALSPAQWRLWVLIQMESDSSAAYNVPLHQLIEGDLNQTAIERALQTIVARHESLRTAIVVVGGEPRQQVQSTVDFRLSLVDVSGESDPEAEAWTLSQAEAQRPFDLEEAPLMRATLVKISPQRHALLLTLHHIVCDGVSIGLLNAEMAQLYTAFSNNRPNPLPKLPIQYRDYTTWLNEWLETKAVAKERQYWLDALSGELPILDLPTDFTRPTVQTFGGRELGVQFDAQQTAQLKQLARREGVTLYMLLLAMLNVLLHRYSRATDIVVGSPVAARPLAELYDQIGFYLNTLPLRNAISAETPFRTFLAQLRRSTTAALDNQLYPMDALINQLDLRRDLSRAPLFDVMLILQNQRDAGFQLGSLKVQTIYQHSGTSKVDLTFNFNESANGLQLAIEYNTDLFSAERIARIGDHWQTLAASIIIQPDLPIGRLVLLDSAELAQLATWNDTACNFDLADLLPDRFERQVAATPDRVAVICAEQSVTYAELNRLANHVAHQLLARGVVADALVGLAANRSIEMVAGLLGILKAGAAYVPIDPTYPAERVGLMVESAEITLCVTQSQLAARFGGDLDLILLDQLDASPCNNPRRTVQPHHLAYVIFTSGSTGKPKGVQIEHRSLVNFMLAMQDRIGLSASDRLLAVTTVSFDIAALELYWPLLHGAQLVVATDNEAADGSALCQCLAQHNITMMQATPATWRMLRTAGWQGSQATRILSGGEALPAPLAADLLPRGQELWNLYGPTEATIWATAQQVTDADALDTNLPVTIGTPIANTTCHILDTHRQPVPIGVVGDLYIGGVQVARGYLGREDLTAERFVKDEDLTVLYRTGDLARWRADGTIEFLGRDDFQVKVRGFRIELGEVEAGLLRHAAVREAVVSVRDEQLVGYIVEDASTTTEQLRQFLGQFLPAYMIPNLYVKLDALPLTLNGKVNRPSLPHPQGQVQLGTPYVAPRNAQEAQIASIWQAVLGVEQVGVDDDFFDLGGHSLNGMRIVAQIQQETGGKLALMDLFRQPTVAALAKLVSVEESKPDQAVEDISAEIAPMSAEIAPMSAEIEPMSEDELALLMGFDDD